MEYLAVLHSTTLNMAPSNWRKRVLEDKVMSREWKLAKIALLEDYIGEEATRTAVVAPEDPNIAMARSYQERREQEKGPEKRRRGRPGRSDSGETEEGGGGEQEEESGEASAREGNGNGPDFTARIKKKKRGPGMMAAVMVMKMECVMSLK